DEEAIFARERSAALAAGEPQGFDAYGFTISFKGVVLEGLEVVFLVLTFGANEHRLPLAATAAAAAVALVVVVGIAVRGPLAQVPENTMKFTVGVLITTFGTFWGAEGAGAHWPGGDAAILPLAAVVLLSALGLVGLLRRPAAVAA
ncbi:MAG TPA: hypothetical protein VMU89_21180, partial [Thermomicrobiaceae bacterium]|nr:hypothetical protein [Thermomicrobiaceae bacterium]